MIFNKLMVLTCMFVSSAMATTWTVDQGGAEDFTTIQEAVDASSDGDVIVVNPGTYYELVDLNEKKVTVQSIGGPDVTIIDGENLRRGVQCISPDLYDGIFSRTIDGFTITNCTDEYTQEGESGGGMTVKACSVVVNNCYFYENSALGYFKDQPSSDGYGWALGGGLYATEGSFMITNCNFWSNTAMASNVSAGGGLCLFEAYNVTITDCSFRENNSIDSSGKGLAAGSGMYVGGRLYSSGILTVIDCIVEENSTVGSFASGSSAVFDSFDSGEINNLTVTLNTSVDQTVDFAGAGFGMSNCGNEASDEYITIKDSTFTNNTLTDSGTDYDYSDMQIMSSSILFEGINSFGESGTYDWERYENPETVLHFSNQTMCNVDSDFVSTSLTTLSFDVDDAYDTEFVEIENEITLSGCLSIVNSSDSLALASVGDRFNLIETGLIIGDFESQVFPKMPEGLGLHLVEEPVPGESTTMISLEVIEVDEVELDEPLAGALDGTPVDIVALDVDNDGYDEIAILFEGSPGTVRVYSVTGDGSIPVVITELITDVGNNPVDIDAGDVDGDGLDDLLIANADDSELTLLIAQQSGGTMSFASTSIDVPGVNQTLSSVAIIDWDEADSLDCVIGVVTNDIYLEDGLQVMHDLSDTPTTGSWFDVPLFYNGEGFLGDSPTSMSGARGEHTGWGFVAGTHFGRLYRSNSSLGSLEMVCELDNSGFVSVDAVNLDDGSGDGQLDLLAASADSRTIYIAEGDDLEPDGFSDVIILYVGEEMTSVIATDVDSDGDQDIIYTAPTSDVPVVVLRNDPPSTLLPDLERNSWSKQDANSSSSPSKVVGGTLSGKDEDDDWIVGAGGDESGLRIGASSMEQTNLFLTEIIYCDEDLSGDGEVSIHDLLELIAAWGLCKSCPADFDLDGDVDVADLLELIAAWGPCSL